MGAVGVDRFTEVPQRRGTIGPLGTDRGLELRFLDGVVSEPGTRLQTVFGRRLYPKVIVEGLTHPGRIGVEEVRRMKRRFRDLNRAQGGRV